MQTIDLRCDNRVEPLAVDTPLPRLSWRTETEAPGWRQLAYRIVASGDASRAERGEGELWDTGWVESGGSTAVPYAGRRLRSRQACWWRVEVRGADGSQARSGVAHWETGLLRPSDWRARWIAPPGGWVNQSDDAAPPPAPLLRREFTLCSVPARARLHVCPLGYGEIAVNGRRVGDDVLSPAFSDYTRTVYYLTYDVTAALRAGRNALGVILGNGWYNCFTPDVWLFKQAGWRAHPKLLLQLEMTDDSGRLTRLVSAADGRWRCAEGPVVFDGLRNGEAYDARREIPGWTEPGFDDADWTQAVVVAPPGGMLRAQSLPPIRVTETLIPRAVRRLPDGAFIVDAGQNLSGWARLRVSGPAGHTVALRYAERLTPEGDLYTANIDQFVRGGDFQTDRYTLKGEGVETWEPRFTYHGFQYIRVENAPAEPAPADIEARVVHTDLPARGGFTCSHDLLNRIQQATLWSTRSNYHGIPTDCPHREKNGWTGDAMLSAEQVLLNFDPRTAYRKWMQDMRDAQRPSGQLPGIVPTGGWGFNWGNGPAWDSAAVLIPWYVYLYDGDPTLLEEQYECMKRYVDYMGGLATDHIVSYGLGDWCPPTGGGSGRTCPAALTSTAYYGVDARTVAAAARLLGRRREALVYARLADRIRAAFQARFLDAGTGLLDGACQTSQACALYQDMLDEPVRDRVFAALARMVEDTNRHIDCGILGAKYVLHALSDGGRADLAFAIATQRNFPSWGHWIEQGATTLWETWDGNASRNHHMFGDISAWFYRALAGLQPDPAAPGFAHVLIRPHPVPGLEWVKCWHDAPHGRIVCNWEQSAGRFKLDLTIPPNSTATVRLPDGATRRLAAGRHALESSGASV